MSYVFDTSSVAVLIETCRAEIALTKFAKVHRLLIPERVKQEYQEGARASRDSPAVERVFSTVTATVDPRLLPYFHFDPTSGEINVISYALQHQNCCCVIDEGFGRNICSLFKVPLTGSIGIIKMMHQQRLLSREDLNSIHECLERSDFYLSCALLRELK